MMVLMYMTVKKMRLSQKGIKMSAFDEWWETYIPVWDIEGRDTREAWNAAIDAAAKVAREWNWRISADDICQDCSNVASEEIAAAIERLKE